MHSMVIIKIDIHIMYIHEEKICFFLITLKYQCQRKSNEAKGKKETKQLKRFKCCEQLFANFVKLINMFYIFMRKRMFFLNGIKLSMST
jgi:hypothetical protein